tara:strand:+ start:89 stop:2410 length:2322 start_codon:yes stop_codon:yes gene_type:complete
MNETLLKSNLLGRDGFVWWIGRVASQTVWKKENTLLGVNGAKQQRVKVRIIGYHPWEETEMPENDLPWAEVMQDPQVGSGQGGIGETMSLQGGETAVGFFLDGEEGQQPVIMGLLNRNQESESTIASDDTITKDKSSNFETFTNESQKKKMNRRDSTFSVKNPTSVVTHKNTVDKAQAAAEKLYTKEVSVPSTCGNDAISRLTQMVKEFIALTNTLEQVGDKFIDPLLEEFVDMQKAIRNIAKQVQGVIKKVLNNIRKGVIGKMNIVFGKFLGALKLVNPLSFLTDLAAKEGFKQILDIIFCIFEKVVGDLFDFLVGMFNKLLGQVIGGPICAIEQFISGILSKVFNMLEGLLDPLMKGLNWLMGGFGSVAKVLRKASAFAEAIYSFLSCDAPKCTAPAGWISTINSGIEDAADDWGQTLKNIDVFSGISSSLTDIGKGINEKIVTGFGTTIVNGQETNVVDLGDVVSAINDPEFQYDGSSTQEILDNLDVITGGNLSGNVGDKLGTIDAAIATMPILGGTNSIFNACNPNNPTTQDDIVTKPGTKAPNCIPPEIRIAGNGSGADLFMSVANNSTIFAIDVINGGSGYDSDTTIAIVDNSGWGSGAQALPQIVNGAIDSVVLLSPGYGYCSGNTGIGTIGVGTTGGTGIGTTGTGPDDGGTGIGTGTYGYVEDIFVKKPGKDYDPDDKVKICSVGVCTYVSIITTPWGGIGEVQWTPWNREMDELPEITIESETGFGADFIPRMRYNVQSTSDIVRPLIGITTVIDCPTTDHQ